MIAAVDGSAVLLAAGVAWSSSQASCSRVVAMVHGVVNEQLLRFAEQHVQDMYGEEWV